MADTSFRANLSDRLGRLLRGQSAREPARARTASVYLVLGVDMNGQKELLGIWIAQTEGAKFWLSVLDLPAESGG